MPAPKKLVLAVVDGLKPSALERAVSTGRAPTLGMLMERGTYVDGGALLVAVLSILAPPLALVALGFLVWLLIGSRKKEGEKYAGLRILR